MSQKNKNVKNPTDTFNQVAQNMGIMLMTVAATIGMLELPDHPNSKVITPNQPTFAFSLENGEGNNPLRREREETVTHYVSYGETQRTPARSGKF